MITIILQSINKSYINELALIRNQVEESIPVPVKLIVPTSIHMLPLYLYNMERMQYRANEVNKYIYEKYVELLSTPGTYLLGIVNGDGYVEGLNFVFGVASPDLRTATIYTQRLVTDKEYNKFFERLLKLILHEFGHLAGLSHCTNRCVMRFSNSLRELDEKPPYYCSKCRTRLEKILS